METTRYSPFAYLHVHALSSVESLWQPDSISAMLRLYAVATCVFYASRLYHLPDVQPPGATFQDLSQAQASLTITMSLPTPSV
jgi:hypothetical protein